jgi:hypothetical protein
MLRSVRHRRYILSCKILISLFVSYIVRIAITTSAITIIDDTADAITTDNNIKVLTREQIESYHNDGYLYIKGGLFTSDLLNELATAVKNAAILASKKKHSSGGYFSLLQSNNIFLPSFASTDRTDQCHNNNTSSPTNHVYRKVVMDSILPKAVAELMNLNPTSGDNLRCLRYVPTQPSLCLVKNSVTTKASLFAIRTLQYFH